MALSRVLFIAGSDCSGGAKECLTSELVSEGSVCALADDIFSTPPFIGTGQPTNNANSGLEADQKTAAAHCVYAMAATTALTAQNTTGVYDVHCTPPDFVGRQIDLCVEDVGVDVVKTGMLATDETIRVVAGRLRKHGLDKVVLDPVMISTSGAKLLPDDAVATLCRELLPLALVVTPNIPEARVILQAAGQTPVEVSCAADMKTLGKAVQALGPKWVLIKGGHVPFRKDLTLAKSDDERKIVMDVLCGPEGEIISVQSPFQESRNTHGTGCTLASTVAVNLANGRSVPDAVRAACNYIEVGIRTAPGLGSGHGPLNHFHSMHVLPFAPGHFVEWLLARPDVRPVWDEFVNHPFVRGLGTGTLPLESFKGYITQDYIYLIHYTRAYALSSYKGRTAAQVRDGAEVAAKVSQEMAMHKAYCTTFGISEAEVMATPELPACTAYTRYILDIGASEDWLALQIAQAPCLLGYGEIGAVWASHPELKKEENPYWSWVANYSSENFVAAVDFGKKVLEEYIVKQTPDRIEELVKIFIHATRMEIEFWEMYPTV
ncbi:hypothetical protein TD95_004665 [Thielaviopsis punctulata]|uniref:Pyridoxamine kinase/Phosphomethylpyrimidine kinase domain-containing protein n=1 Tax=Thielaviopsis punctulata TaxID=72032 RepID=A0A0F4ZKT8_9PEZI|nr:hypothetical protein TD95_004665 [Thielaviopsis punctulata]